MQAVTEFMQECLYFIESQQSRLVLGRLGEIHDDGYMWTAVFTSLFIYPLFFVTCHPGTGTFPKTGMEVRI